MVDSPKKLAILGGGAMGGAFLEGLVSAGWPPDDIIVAELSSERRDELGRRFGVTLTGDASEAAASARTAILAVKPQDVPEILGYIEAAASLELLISVCAGIPLSVLEGKLHTLPIIRAMPNMPVRLRAGAIAIAAGVNASDAHMRDAEELLGAVGKVLHVREDLFDAVTALSGSGPAYVFLLAEALIEGGVSSGIPRAVADPLTRNVLLGASNMLAENPTSPAELRNGVTSPAGTTAAALRVLEAEGFRSMIYEALHAAAERSHQLGRETEASLSDGQSAPIPINRRGSGSSTR